MKETTSKVRSTVRVNSPGLMEAPIMVSSLRITLTDSVSMSGPTVESSKENGKIIKWKAEECLRGQTIGDMRENISTTRKRDMVSSTGPMAESTRENGKMVNNTASVSTPQPLGKPEKDNGLKVKE